MRTLLRTLITAALTTLALTSLAQAAPRYATDHVLVRLRPSALAGAPARPASLRPAQISSQRFRAALVSAAAVSLEPAFPDFRPEDVNSTNLRGERVTLEDLSNIYVVRLGPQADVPKALQALRAVPDVEVAEADPIVSIAATPNDSLFAQQWWLDNVGQTGCDVTLTPDTDINAPQAWDMWTGNDPTTKVGIIDTGIQPDHEDLRLVEFAASPFSQPDNFGHGTAVAGIVSATGNNGKGVTGVCQGVTVVSINTSTNSSGGFTQYTLSLGVDYCRAHGIPIANISAGGVDQPATVPTSVYVNAYLAGTLVVAAMGNDNANEAFYPAAQEREVFAVGALINGRRWDDRTIHTPACDALVTQNEFFLLGSNFGNFIDVAAPGGRGIATTRWSGKQPPSPYYNCIPCGGMDFGGTSAATPVVSGIAALLKSHYPSLLGEDLARVIKSTCQDVAPPGPDDSTGMGLVRADAALNFLASPNVLFQSQSTNMPQVSSTVAPMTLSGIPGLTNGTYNVQRYLLRSDVTFGKDYVSPPNAWTRNSGSRGTNIDNPKDPNFATITSLTAQGCSIETYVFDIMSQSDNTHIMWWPCTIPEATAAMTAVAPGDVTPPATPGVSLSFSCTDVFVSWADTGDDGTSGQATAWELRSSSAPINTTNWSSATLIGAGTPGPSGTEHTLDRAAGPCSPLRYYGLRLQDNVGNWSGIGTASGQTPCFHPPLQCDDGLQNPNPDARPEPASLALEGELPGVIRSSLRLNFVAPSRLRSHDLSLDILDLTGRSVRRWSAGPVSTEGRTVEWDLRAADGRPVPAGVYFLRAQLGPQFLTRRFTVLR